MFHLLPNNNGWILNPFFIQNQNHDRFEKLKDSHKLENPFIFEKNTESNNDNNSVISKKRKFSSNNNNHNDDVSLQYSNEHHESIKKTFSQVVSDLKSFYSNNNNSNSEKNTLTSNDNINNNENNSKEWFHDFEFLEKTTFFEIENLKNDINNLKSINNKLIINQLNNDICLNILDEKIDCLKQEENNDDKQNSNSFIIPAKSSFINTNIEENLRKIATIVNNINLLVVDFPWENKSIERSKKYSTMSPKQIKSLPLESFLSSIFLKKYI